MEVNVLQSIIKRNGNRIADLESLVVGYAHIVLVPDDSKVRKEIKALAAIQKALKKELANKIKQARMQRVLSYWRNR